MHYRVSIAAFFLPSVRLFISSSSSHLSLHPNPLPNPPRGRAVQRRLLRCQRHHLGRAFSARAAPRIERFIRKTLESRVIALSSALGACAVSLSAFCSCRFRPPPDPPPVAWAYELSASSTVANIVIISFPVADFIVILSLRERRLDKCGCSG
jgi:hypothetical protein